MDNIPDINNINKKIKQLNILAVITTMKDYIKIRSALHCKVLYVIDVTPKIVEEKKLIGCLQKKLSF